MVAPDSVLQMVAGMSIAEVVVTPARGIVVRVRVVRWQAPGANIAEVVATPADHVITTSGTSERLASADTQPAVRAHSDLLILRAHRKGSHLY